MATSWGVRLRCGYCMEGEGEVLQNTCGVLGLCPQEGRDRRWVGSKGSKRVEQVKKGLLRPYLCFLVLGGEFLWQWEAADQLIDKEIICICVQVCVDTYSTFFLLSFMYIKTQPACIAKSGDKQRWLSRQNVKVPGTHFQKIYVVWNFRILK